MPIFQLDDSLRFPHPDLAENNGLLAIGGDLSPKRLITAYSLGIFPWYSDNEPILWWFTTPRLVLFLDDFHIGKRLQRYKKNGKHTITHDYAFESVIELCGQSRRDAHEQTWITDDMMQAYTQLHKLGYAHSTECWLDDELVGGLYGICLGNIFFGESMFSIMKSGSQFALIALVELLKSKDFLLIDCQMTTNHLLRFGAKEITGQEFQQILKQNITNLSPNKPWTK